MWRAGAVERQVQEFLVCRGEIPFFLADEQFFLYRPVSVRGQASHYLVEFFLLRQAGKTGHQFTERSPRLARSTSPISLVSASPIAQLFTGRVLS